MKQLEYAYFHIYHFYYQRNQGLTSLPARMQTMYTVSISAGGWVLLLQTIFLRLVRHAWFTSQDAAMIFAIAVYLGAALLCYRIFITRSYDEKIYQKYETDRANKPGGLLFAFMMVTAPYILLALFKQFFPAQH